MKRILPIFLTLTLALGALTGCMETVEETTIQPTPAVETTTPAPSVVEEEPSVEPTVIRLNEVTHSVFYAPLYAAMELGFFAEENIEIELTNGGGADQVMTAVITGESDIGLAGPEACIYVQTQGLDDSPMIFAQLTKRDGAFIVGRTDETFSWDNLIGKTIIGGRKGGVPEMTLEYVMTQNGVIPHVDATVDTAVEFAMMAGAFTGGYGDYVSLFEPTATMVEQEGLGYVLASTGQESGEIPYTAFFASQSYISENADLVQRFTNAIAKGQGWIQTADPSDIAAAMVNQFPDTDLETLTAVAQRYQEIDAWNATPVMKEEALERLEDVMELAGELTERVVFENVVDNSFALAVS